MQGQQEDTTSTTENSGLNAAERTYLGLGAVHDVFMSNILPKDSGCVAHGTVRANILLMNFSCEILKNPGANLGDLAKNVIWDYAVSKAVVGVFGAPVAWTYFGISATAGIANSLDIQCVDNMVEDRINKITALKLPPDIEEEMILNQMEMLASCYFLKQIGYGYDATVGYVGNVCNNLLSYLNRKIIPYEIKDVWSEQIYDDISTCINNSTASEEIKRIYLDNLQSLPAVAKVMQFFRDIAETIAEIPKLPKEKYHVDMSAIPNIIGFFKEQIHTVKVNISKSLIQDTAKNIKELSNFVDKRLANYNRKKLISIVLMPRILTAHPLKTVQLTQKKKCYHFQYFNM